MPDGLPNAATQLTPHVNGDVAGTVGNDSTPHWSPDGAHIVFTRGQEGLRIVDVVTKQVSAQIETGFHPDWGFVGAVQDEDGDGVLDNDDECPGTAGGSPVKDNGCAIDQICPCDGFPNHGGYVECTARAAEDFVQTGIISEAKKEEIVSVAAKSSCGKI